EIVKEKSGKEDHENIILGYLQVINSAVLKFLHLYRDDLQFIDRPTYIADKIKVQEKIDAVLARPELEYPGNMADFVLNEFSAEDSSRVAGILKNYAEFQRFVIPKTFLPIA